jgi:hypothetical protein
MKKIAKKIEDIIVKIDEGEALSIASKVIMEKIL